MGMLENIVKRKNVKTFINEELDLETIDNLVDFLSALNPPEPGIDWNFDTLPYLDLMRVSRTEPGVKAPHYLILRAERLNFSLQNSGYIGQMAALYLAGLNIASSWLGGVSITSQSDFPDSLPFVCAIAFGHSDEPFYDTLSQRERSPLKQFAHGNSDPYTSLLEYMQAAPSAYNKQPCRVVADDNARLHLYRKKPFLGNPLASYMQCIDSGAMIACACAAAPELGMTASVSRLQPEPTFKSLIYQATIALSGC